MVNVTIESHLGGKIADMVAEMLPASHYAVVMDANTAEALGDDVLKALESKASSVLLDGIPYASMASVEHIRRASPHADALIAVGSGTINDLTKYASHLDNKPYGVFPTAPSMNGYSSANASISVDGHKTTLKAHAPNAIWCDLDVLSKAPLRLIQSGLGDSLCRPTAQYDWLLSHLLLDTPYSSEPFYMLAPYESDLFDNADALIARDRDAITLLIKTLLASGDGMRESGGSYPASQAEHMIAHTIEMMSDAPSPHYHGEEIAATTLTAARLQHRFIDHRKPPSFSLKPFPTNDIHETFSEAQCTAFQEEYEAKHKSVRETDINARLENNWERIQATLHKVMLPLKKLEQILTKAGMQSTPQELGWDGNYNHAVEIAPFTRNRFTVLDVI